MARKDVKAAKKQLLGLFNDADPSIDINKDLQRGFALPEEEELRQKFLKADIKERLTKRQEEKLEKARDEAQARGERAALAREKERAKMQDEPFAEDPAVKRLRLEQSRLKERLKARQEGRADRKLERARDEVQARAERAALAREKERAKMQAFADDPALKRLRLEQSRLKERLKARQEGRADRRLERARDEMQARAERIARAREKERAALAREKETAKVQDEPFADENLTPDTKTFPKGKAAALAGGAVGAGLIGYGATGGWGDEEDKPKPGLMLQADEDQEITTELPEDIVEDKEPKPAKKLIQIPSRPRAAAKADTKAVTEEDPQIELLNKRLDQYSKLAEQLKEPELTASDAREKMMNDLANVRDNREATLQWAELAQNLFGALTKYAAAKEGLDRGLDMSKAEIQKTDWDKKIKRAIDRYENEVERLTDKFEKEDKSREKFNKTKADLASDMADVSAKIAQIESANKRFEERMKETRLSRQQRAAEAAANRRLKQEAIDLRRESDRLNRQAKELGMDKPTEEDDVLRRIGTAFDVEGKEGVERQLRQAKVLENLDPTLIQALKKPNIIQRLTGAEGNVDTELAGQVAKLSGEDRQAFIWASQNPEDPRAEAILNDLGL